MTTTRGSITNSKLFTSLPLSKEPKEPNSQKNTKKYILKGHNDSSYEHKGGDDDIFIIKGPNGSFKLYRKSLVETLHDLHKQAHISVKVLSASHTESFRSIVDAMKLLYGTTALYEVVLKDIEVIFADIKNPKPGTVGAYFVGCFSDDKFSGPPGCSPRCTSSLPPAIGTHGYSECDDMVLIYTDNNFNTLNDKHTEHAYIYVGEYEFIGFTYENVTHLKEAGIKSATLIYGNPDGSYREVTKPIEVDKLPIRRIDNTPETTTSQSGTATGVILLIIIILILILVGLLAYRGECDDYFKK